MVKVVDHNSGLSGDCGDPVINDGLEVDEVRGSGEFGNWLGGEVRFFKGGVFLILDDEERADEFSCD